MRWVVMLDGVVDMEFGSRAAAREHAKWLRGTPDVLDRAAHHDDGGQCAGDVVVVDREHPPEWCCDAPGCIEPEQPDTGYCLGCGG